MKEYDHMCDHPTCYETENDCTIYEVQSRHGAGSFKVCGSHLIEREVDRAKAIVTDAGSAANAAVLSGLQE